MIITVHSLEETASFGQKLSQELQPGTILCFFGELGSGKTTLIKTIASRLTGLDPSEICSPTFTTLNIYEGTVPVYHFDLYRLPDHQAFLERGLDEYFDLDGVCCIEWSERIESILPDNVRRIEIQTLDQTKREIRVT